MLRGKRNPPPSLHRTYSSQFHTPLSPNSLTANSNVTWTFHPLSTLVYLILVGLVHITVSVNLDAYMHKSGGGATAYASDTPSLALAFLGLGRQVTADGTRLWYADAWTITAALHGAVTWTLMHWIKGNADFYGQGECNAMTWYEQVRVAGEGMLRSNGGGGFSNANPTLKTTFPGPAQRERRPAQLLLLPIPRPRPLRPLPPRLLGLLLQPLHDSVQRVRPGGLGAVEAGVHERG